MRASRRRAVAWRAGVGPVGRGVDQRVEDLDGAAGSEPVGHVALVRQAGQLEPAHARRHAGKRSGNVVGMIAAGVVVVGDDDDIGAGEMLGEVGPATCRRRRRWQVAAMP